MPEPKSKEFSNLKMETESSDSGNFFQPLIGSNEFKGYSVQTEINLLSDAQNSYYGREEMFRNRNFTSSFVKRTEREKNNAILVFEIDSRTSISVYKEMTLRTLLYEILEEINSIQNQTTLTKRFLQNNISIAFTIHSFSILLFSFLNLYQLVMIVLKPLLIN
jgi:hypothetical protein